MAPQKETKFKQTVEQGYTFTGEAIPLGGSMLDNQVVSGLTVSIPVKTLNRHGLIAGATGSGKTWSLQLLAEELSVLSYRSFSGNLFQILKDCIFLFDSFSLTNNVVVMSIPGTES